MLKKLLCLALALVCVLTFAACGGDNGGSKDSSSKKQDASSEKLESASRVTSGGVSMNSEVESQLLESPLATKDYGGKEFKFYFWYQYGENVDRKIDAFNKAHNAKITTEIGTEFAEDIAKSIVEGVPYDIIANHSDKFPQSVISDILAPLDEHLTDSRDFFNVDKINNGGLSEEIINAFSWGDHKYTAGSAQSIYSMVFYYNKKLFADSGLEDPYDLWKSGEWTWDKCVEMSNEVTDIENTTVFLEEIPIFNWLTLNGVKYVSVDNKNKTAKENLNDPKTLAAIQKWQDLYLSDTPMCSVTYCSLFGSSKITYAAVSYTDVYAQWADKALNTAIFDKNADNLGVVPMPTGLIEKGTYAGHVPQGYAAAKGAKDTSVAVCYALFESRLVETELPDGVQLPPEIMNAVNQAFATKGFLGFSGWKDSTGTTPNTYMKELAAQLKEGADVASSVEALRPEIAKCLQDTMDLA